MIMISNNRNSLALCLSSLDLFCLNLVWRFHGDWFLLSTGLIERFIQLEREKSIIQPDPRVFSWNQFAIKSVTRVFVVVVLVWMFSFLKSFHFFSFFFFWKISFVAFEWSRKYICMSCGPPYPRICVRTEECVFLSLQVIKFSNFSICLRILFFKKGLQTCA